MIGRRTDVGSDVIPRFFHKSALLDDGRVVVVGGLGLTLVPMGLTSFADISVFDPKTNEFTHLRTGSGAVARLAKGRSSHTLTALKDGRVLIAGGNVDASGTFTGRASDTVEFLMPLTGELAAGPPMNEKRAFHTATRLGDDRVLVAGGASWQVFDPRTNAWSAPVRMHRTRMRHAAVRLPGSHATPSDRILVIGGLGSGGRGLEILDPARSTSTSVSSMLPTYLNDLAAAPLEDGRVLIIGGQRNFGLETTGDVYLFDPADESLRRLADVPARPHGISDHEAIAIGRYVVIAGGEQQYLGRDTELDYLAIFNGETLEWEFVGALHQPRDDFSAVRLQDDRILFIGGAISRLGVEAPTGTAEIFEMVGSDAGDMNGDNRIDFADISRFVDALMSSESADANAWRNADMNRDERIDDDDISAFCSRLVLRSP